MAWTYDELKEAVQEYLQNDEQSFIDRIPDFVRQAEERILYQAQLPAFRQAVSGSMTTGDPYLMIPSDFLSAYSMSVDNGGVYEYVMLKDVSYIRQAYPDKTATGTPKYFALFDKDYFIVGPTPDQDYSTELHYMYRPESIVDQGTSWIGTHAETALLYGALVEGYTYLKGTPEVMQQYRRGFDQAINELTQLGTLSQTTTEYHDGTEKTNP